MVRVLRWRVPIAAAVLGACHRAGPAPAPGSVLVRAYALADSTRPASTLDLAAWPAATAEPGGAPAAAWTGAGNEARLGPLPAGRYLVRVRAIGYDPQRVPVEIRPGCADTLTVLMPTVSGDIGPTPPPRVGRWRTAGCPRGA